VAPVARRRVGRRRQVALAGQNSPPGPDLVVDAVGSSARRISLADCGRLNCTVVGLDAQLGQRLGVVSSARSKGLLARPCATSQVSARLTGHSSSSGVSIQSRISPNSERCCAERVSRQCF
jgi:hypothetical protein